MVAVASPPLTPATWPPQLTGRDLLAEPDDLVLEAGNPRFEIIGRHQAPAAGSEVFGAGVIGHALGLAGAMTWEILWAFLAATFFVTAALAGYLVFLSGIQFRTVRLIPAREAVTIMLNGSTKRRAGGVCAGGDGRSWAV